MSYNHKNSTREVSTQLTTPVVATAGLQVVIGTAPVNLAENPMAVTNKPVIAYSFTEASKLLGYSDDFADYTLCQSMDASFRVFSVAPIIFINVLDPTTHTKSYTGSAVAITDGVATIKSKGILLDTLALETTADPAVKLTKDEDYLASFDSEGNVLITILDTAKTTGLTAVNVTATQLDPTKVTAADIIGGYDALTGKDSGLEVIRQIYPTLGLVPGLILAPGWSHIPTIAAAMKAKCEDINGLFTCESVIDMSTVTTKVYTGLKTAKETLGIIDKHAILLWPKLKLGDKVYYFSALWAPMTAYCDAEHGDVPYKSPSNELLSVSAAVLEDGTEVILDNDQAALVNSYGIVTAINDQGWKAWGNNTSIFPTSTDPKDRWIACRRMMSWYRNHFILTYKSKVDDPINPRLVEALVDSENQYLNSLSSSGSIAGGEISYSEADNPPSKILNGEVHFGTKIAFYTPAEWIENVIEFDPTLLRNALTGGNE